MGLREVKGNMYNFITHTWNPIKGKCSHNCTYCSCKAGEKEKLHLDENDLNSNLGLGNIIFVGSGTDMFADDVPEKFIREVLHKCCLSQVEDLRDKNQFYFQTKNPKRFDKFKDFYPEDSKFILTLESNRNHDVSFTEFPLTKMKHFIDFEAKNKIVTIEPVLKFDLIPFVDIIKRISPMEVNIGADSKGNNLEEPTKKELFQLIESLKKVCTVNIKQNAKRILFGEYENVSK